MPTPDLKTTLHISDGLQLPVDAATQTFGILAKKGAGKSNAAVVMAEEMWDAGIPWVAIDPKGDWWGVRSSDDGTKPGLALPVFGGEHGDVPLEPTAGALVADLVAEQSLTSVLDVSEFSKGDQRRFLLAFADRLIRRNREPVHLFLEEAHEYLPQRVMRDEAQLVGAWAKIVKQGRFRGIGATLVSQRSASLNKDVLTQVDSLIVLRTTSPQDRKAVLAWVEEHDVGHDLVASLPSLEDGEAWIWSPEFLRTTERFRFRRRRTFDSGATPKLGQTRRAPATLADVDLGAIKEQMADTIERAQADDPKVLRRRVADLEKQLAQRPTEKVVETVVERVEVPVFDEERILGRLDDSLHAVGGAVRSALEDVLADSVEDVRRIVAEEGRRDRQDVPRARPTGGGGAARQLDGGRAQERPDPAVRRDARRSPVPRATTPTGALPRGEQRILTAVAQYPHGVTREQLTVLTGYKRSSRDTYLQRLRERGCIDTAGTTITATAEGVDALGPYFEPLPTGAALRDHWLAELPEGERRILAELIAAYPDGVPRDDLSDTTGYKRSSRDTYLQRLRARQLVTTTGDPRAADVLFD